MVYFEMLFGTAEALIADGVQKNAVLGNLRRKQRW